MNKNLEALERIKYKLSSTKANGYWEDLDIIGNALNKLETLEEGFRGLTDTDKDLVQERIRNQKKLKALQIIKEKQVNVQNFKSTCSTMSYEQYLFMWQEGCFMGIMLTSKTMLIQEEYDLLKEVLL